MTTYLTTRSGLVHAASCPRLRPGTERWAWRPADDGPGVARACGACLGGVLPDDGGRG